MKLRMETLTGHNQEVEVDPQNSILDRKVCRPLLTHKSNVTVSLFINGSEFGASLSLNCCKNWILHGFGFQPEFHQISTIMGISSPTAYINI